MCSIRLKLIPELNPAEPLTYPTGTLHIRGTNVATSYFEGDSSVFEDSWFVSEDIFTMYPNGALQF